MHGHGMTRVPALPFSSESADAQIDAAVLRLVDLFARQAARELAADAPDTKETPHATPDP
jgi:hypothetical protein